MPVIVDFLIVGLTLLAPALGGSTYLWTQALFLLLAGLIVFAQPSRNLLPRPLAFAFLALIILAAIPFLPAAWLPQFPWRMEFEKLGAQLPATFTPQPWLTLEKFALMLGGLFWAAYLLTRGVTVRRRLLLSIYAGGILALTLAAFYCYFTKTRTILWNPLNGQFGFFPNRNHTGNVLALGGIVMLALAQDGFLRRSKVGMFWLVSYLVVAVALVINYSRAGVALFFLGSAAWFVWITWTQRRFKAMAVGASCLLFLLSAFFLAGGKTAERFLTKHDTQPDAGFRWLVQTDAMDLYNDASWHGIGMANFRAVFPAYRKASANEFETIHPESDWLLFGIDLGWFAPFLIWGSLGYLLWKRWPSSQEPSFPLRAACIVAVLAFVVHGFFDVPGHRFGAVLPALFLLSIAQRDEAFDVERRWLGKFYRTGAFAFSMLGIAWMLTSFGPKRLPNSAAVFDVKREIMQAYGEGRQAEVVRLSTEGLRIAPLDWYLYYNRGLAQAWVLSTPERALADFARAYYLQPQTPELYFAEGRAWLGREPELAVAAWAKALNAAPDKMDDGLFHRMLSEGGKHSEARPWLKRLARSDADHYLRFLSLLGPDEFKAELDALFESDAELRGLSAEQRKRLFDLWRKRDAASLAAKLEANPSWSDVGWLPLAQSLATRRQFEAAYSMAITNVVEPSLPKETREGNVEELERIMTAGDDLVTGYALYVNYMRDGREGDALKVLRRLSKGPEAPGYIHYLEAQLAAKAGDWANAWAALHKFIERSGSG